MIKSIEYIYIQIYSTPQLLMTMKKIVDAGKYIQGMFKIFGQIYLSYSADCSNAQCSISFCSSMKDGETKVIERKS